MGDLFKLTVHPSSRKSFLLSREIRMETCCRRCANRFNEIAISDNEKKSLFARDATTSPLPPAKDCYPPASWQFMGGDIQNTTAI